MEKVSNAFYYARRAIEAQALADAASDEAVAAIHREMAGRYRELADLNAKQPQSRKVTG